MIRNNNNIDRISTKCTCDRLDFAGLRSWPPFCMFSTVPNMALPAICWAVIWSMIGVVTSWLPVSSVAPWRDPTESRITPGVNNRGNGMWKSLAWGGRLLNLWEEDRDWQPWLGTQVHNILGRCRGLSGGFCEKVYQHIFLLNSNIYLSNNVREVQTISPE